MRFFFFTLAGILCFAMKLSAIGLPTSEVALVGRFAKGPVNLALRETLI